ncbi:linear amide C-N hydrolase [Vibrio sp. 10N.261.46.E12]|uniref:linear amide C-N hydrolase n=2 Tax=Vibrio TaxID=662 RepID=UPI0009784C07|nr:MULTISPECIES: linear amide C-N hydrolase [unclassified Vibrio]OMO36541.1 choloylglycine hydrolase [Vibrio sp. 10N.261.45.E1]PMJ30773.1 choloylglycine hydrolase [Vibrio sp. 10N.286.45.B6]PMM73908.1 choloylglycine hydrolase [Vibrio sp. 10N.261.46.F12]PMM87886.1 choloylglycine hydrolase [Vibrio sp. 10N.261.46.E8]PMN42147.1 choloylglycine hydrolase [Vibrio sp. 10N.261.45.E2]
MKKLNKFMTATIVAAAVASATASACTSFVINSEDGAVVYGRTMEWGAFDVNSRLAISPRGHVYTGTAPDGKQALTYSNKYGFVAMDAVLQDLAVDGMNEKGLVVGALYHPGAAEFPEYNPLDANSTISTQALANYMLGQFATVEEVAEGLKDVTVIMQKEEKFGNSEIPIHWTVVDANNDRIVVEYLNGELTVFDNPIGVMTNSPSFDWHMNNLSNYLYLQQQERGSITLNGVDIKPTGGGTGLLGVPGDFTPPSRFVRAVAYTQIARDTKDGADAVNEAFRILDGFQLPVGASEGGAISADYLKYAQAATTWTTTADATNLKYYYHTQFDRQVRMIDLNKIDFSNTGEGIQYLELDKTRTQSVVDVTPSI